MDKKLLNILLIKDEYDGAYQSFNYFYDQLTLIIKGNDYNLFIANNVNEANYHLANSNIDFSINIGQYKCIINGEYLFDKFKIINYQWVIDNPLRYPGINNKSKYNRLIFIDKSFSNYPGFDRKDYLFLPLPFIKNSSSKFKNKKIILPIKIKGLESYNFLIGQLEQKDLLNEFLNSYSLDQKFNEYFLQFVNKHKISNLSLFFEITNGIVRLKKRLAVINCIKKHDVFVFSNKPNDILFNDNVHFMKPISYQEMIDIFKEGNIIININPNYDYCIHDRVLSSVNLGSVVLSDENELLKEIDFPKIFSFNQLDILDDLIEDIIINFDAIKEKQIAALNKYCSSKILDMMIRNFKEKN